MVANLYVAATQQNDGKTVVSLGLMHAISKRIRSIAYMKPVGQQYNIIDGNKIDKDAVLMHTAYCLQDDLPDMSPIAVPHRFVQNYLLDGDATKLEERVVSAYQRLSANKDFVLIEGTGHAGVGSVFDMSNAHVAKMLNAPIVLVTIGGIGRPIDELVLNKNLFDTAEVPLKGAILNKVRIDKLEKVKKFARMGLERKGIELLGVIPFDPVLWSPTFQEVVKDIRADVLCGERFLTNNITKIMVGAALPHTAVELFGDGTLLITPGDREDLILAALAGKKPCKDTLCHIAGLILTCGIVPHESILQMVQRAEIPTACVESDTFTTASRINKSVFKIWPEDTAKIKEAAKVIETFVDIDKLCDMVSLAD